MNYATPDYGHYKEYETVYEPAEDTFLFLDALEKEQEFINKIRPLISLEIGSGSGIVSTFLSRILNTCCIHFCTDRNNDACLCTHKSGVVNNIRLEPITTDLVEGLIPRLKHSVDILLFNPPYVVTPSDEINSTGLPASWAGGLNGREVMDRLFPLISNLLSSKGAFYLVVIKENKPEEIKNIFSQLNFKSETVLSRRSGPEFLSILKFTRLSNS